MTNQLFREADGNVILKSDYFAIRFHHLYGGTGLDWWREPYPGPITSDFPGAGASINFEVGQDPTQATSDGFNTNPIAMQGNATSIQKYNYYARELDIQAATPYPLYTIQMFAPDFWLSHEPMDDFPIASPNTNWFTHYQHPNTFDAHFQTYPTSLIFSNPSPSNYNVGFIYPNNEIQHTPKLLRRYPNGRVAAHTRISLAHAKHSAAGIAFRQILNPHQPSNNDFNSVNQTYNAPGYLFTVNTDNRLQFKKIIGNGTSKIIYEKSLSTAHKNLLKSQGGLEIEFQTHNGIPGQITLLIEGQQVFYFIDATSILGEATGLFGQVGSGYIIYNNRHFVDVSTTITATYKALDNATIQSHHTIENPYPSPNPFYRANMPGMFLNPTLFNATRETRAIDINDNHTDIEGVYNLKDYKSFWCGNDTGTLGLHATPVSTTIDDAPATHAHVLLQKHGFNDEFIMHFNPFPYGTPPIQARKIDMIINWRTHL